MSKRTRLWLGLGSGLAIGATLVPCSAESAQATIWVEVEQRSWAIPAHDSVPSSRITQTYVPLVVSGQFTPKLDYSVSVAHAWSELAAPLDPHATVDGNSAVTLAAAYHMYSNRLVLHAGATVPSGKRNLSTTDVVVVRALDPPTLDFGLRHYGRGPEIGLGITTGQSYSNGIVASVGIGGIIRGRYSLQASLPDYYYPASEFSITGGIDLGEGNLLAAGAIHLDATYRRFSADKVGRATMFEEGSELDYHFMARVDPSVVTWTAEVRGIFKASSISGDVDSSSVGEAKLTSGNLVEARLGAGIRAMTRATVAAELVYGRAWHSDLLGRNGATVGVGPVLEMRVFEMGRARLRGTPSRAHPWSTWTARSRGTGNRRRPAR